MIVWSMDKYCVIPLCVLSLGHFAVVVQGLQIPSVVVVSSELTLSTQLALVSVGIGIPTSDVYQVSTNRA